MEFKKQLNEIKELLSQKKKFNELCRRANVSLRTIYNTFDANSFDELKGVRLDVYKEAIKMVDEINSLQAMAAEALSK